MAARRITISLAISEDYKNLATETVNLPANTDITRVGRLVERKLAGMVDIVAEFYPAEPESPIESTSNVS